VKRISVWLASNGEYWRAEWNGPDGPKHRSLGNKAKVNERQARQEVRRIAHELNTGALAPGHVPTLQAWVDHYRKTRQSSPATAARMDITIDKYLIPHFGGGRRMDAVSVTDAREWLAWLRTQPGIVSDHTILSHVNGARALWTACAEAHPMPNPFRGKSLKVRVVWSTPDVPNLTTEDVLAIIDACPTPAWRALVALCGLAGLRRSEALAMTWDRVEWAGNRLRVPQAKTAKATGRADRYCLMTADLKRILEGCNPGRGRVAPVSIVNLSRSLRTMIGRECPKWDGSDPFQGLRRWRASTWKDEYPKSVTDSWLGHGPEVSRRYYYAVPDHHYGAESELERLRREVEALRRQ
jgi:integrase